MNTEILKAAISQNVQKLYDLQVAPILSVPEPEFGDASTNIALQLAKQVGRRPSEIAEEIAEELRKDSKLSLVSVAGPGFINITYSNESLMGMLAQDPAKGRLNQTVVIETNNPNPFKAMHIGHAFNAILADTIANLLENDGADVTRVSYHGDVGLHVGKSMYSLLRYVDGDINKLLAIEPDERNNFMSRMYAEGSAAYKNDEIAKSKIQDLSEQSFSPKSDIYKEVYDIVKSWSFEQIDELVRRLGNHKVAKRFLESEADARGVEIVRSNTPKVFQESNGAFVFPGSKYGAFDNAFVGSNGRGLYAARDLGLMELKNESFHPDKSYIVTAEEQKDYFKGVIAAAEQCFPEFKDLTINIAHGTVKLTTGKMSSRDGDVVEIAWLFEKIAEAVSERGSQPDDQIVASALRYQFLKVRIGSDVVFDINEAISITGNSGPYLQYAHARARSILAKTDKQSADKLTNLNPSERTLLKKITEYQAIYQRSVRELAPHHLCHFLYELCQEFNRFYENNRIIDDEREAERLLLATLYADCLRDGLKVLGINAPEKM